MGGHVAEEPAHAEVMAEWPALANVMTEDLALAGVVAEGAPLVGLAEATLVLFLTGAEVDPLCSCSVILYLMDRRWPYLCTSPEKNSSTSSRAAVGNSLVWDILTWHYSS